MIVQTILIANKISNREKEKEKEQKGIWRKDLPKEKEKGSLVKRESSMMKAIKVGKTARVKGKIGVEHQRMNLIINTQINKSRLVSGPKEKEKGLVFGFSIHFFLRVLCFVCACWVW